MTLEKFLNSIRATKEENYEKKFIKTKYFPYEQKMLVCSKIVKHTSYQEVEGEKILTMNTPLRQMLFILNLIDIYTVIEVDFTKGFDTYNKLCETEYLGLLMSLIPQSEIAMFNSIMEMTIDDFIANERDLVSYIDTKMASLKIVADSALTTLQTLAEENISKSQLDENK